MKNKDKLKIERFFTNKEIHPYNQVKWKKIDAIITDSNGKTIFSQKDLEVPKNWSQMAVNVMASKYFRGDYNSNIKEKSLKNLVDRVVDTITDWGVEQDYFDSTNGVNFNEELKYLLINQYAAFNSPVWFNLGIEEQPQVSACFINSVNDDLQSILNLAVTESKLFKYGSGTGTNFSTLRGSNESLSGGGTASGPVSFMKGFDAFAGIIKSGGKLRRAAKMVILNVDHPDIEEFITSKVNEEKKAKALIKQGYDGSFNGEAYKSVAFQNANHSVRVTDSFMLAVKNNEEFELKNIKDKSVFKKIDANILMDKIIEAAYFCGDPGIQFDTTINKWHTCKKSGRINASNPCSEFMFLDNSACNLASLNLIRFANNLLINDGFDFEAFSRAIRILIIAQDIIIDKALYPTKEIADNSKYFRPLGLGYANLGAYLMSCALSYNSDDARTIAAYITACMTGQAYLTSIELSRIKGCFGGYVDNKDSVLEVLQLHKDSIKDFSFKLREDRRDLVCIIWDKVIEEIKIHGIRNSQVTLLAPTGTIGFLMDCDTTGIEPDIALVKYKQLSGGGIFKLVNKSVKLALKKLNYSNAESQSIIAYIENNDTIENAPFLKHEHLEIFDCALCPKNGKRFISPEGHIKMMAAVQPFLSGAISKTVNLPSNITTNAIKNIYFLAWELSLKSITIYRDGSKKIQPVLIDKDNKKNIKLKPIRKKLPNERKALTHKFTIGGHEGYLTIGMYEDGNLGEIFITMSKEGSTISGLMDSFATVVSLALQYGVPLEVLIDKFSHTRFEPAGFTGNEKVPIAKSIMDYIFRWIQCEFVNKNTNIVNNDNEYNIFFLPVHDDSPSCVECGSIMVRNGTCHKCINCGSTSGCS